MRFNLARLKRQLEELTGREYSWSEIARRTGLHRHTIERIAANQTTQVRLDTLERLLAFFHAEGMAITLNDLFSDVDPHLEPLDPAGMVIVSPKEREDDSRVVPVYTNVRPPMSDFTGRTQEIEAICALFRSGHRSVLLYGESMGKTELALAVAHRLRAQYPDVHLFVDLQPHGCPIVPEAVLRSILRALRPQERLPETLSELQALYHHWLRGNTWQGILVLDRAAHAGQVAPLLPPPEGYIVLVTARHQLALPDTAFYAVTPLALPDATALLRRLLREGGRLDLIGPKHAEGLRRLAEVCQCQPLPLRLMAAQLAAQPELSLEELLHTLKAELVRYGNLKGESSLAAAVSICLQRLADEDAELVQFWHLLTLFTNSFSVEEVTMLTGHHRLEAEFFLKRLVQRRLVEQVPEQDRYEIHVALRRYAFVFSSGMDPYAWTRAQVRFAYYFLSLAKEAETLYAEGDESALQALERFEAIWPNLQAAWEWMSAQESPAALQFLDEFPQAVGQLLDLRLTSRERIPFLLAGLGAARRLGNRKNESVHLRSLGSAYHRAGELDQAVRCYEEALRIDRETGNQEGEAADLIGLANTLYRRGDIHTAADYYRHALKVVRDLGNRLAESVCLANLGTISLDEGDISQAITFYEKALRIDREIGNRRGESADLGNLGNAYYRLGRITEAIAHYKQALKIARTLGDRRAFPRLLANLATAYFRQGEWQQAIELYEKALELAREVGDRSSEGFVLGSLGVVHRAMGRLQRAIQHYRQALELARDIGDRRAEAAAAWNLGLVYEQIGEYQRAVELMEITVAYEREVDHPDFERDVRYLERLRRLADEDRRLA